MKDPLKRERISRPMGAEGLLRKDLALSGRWRTDLDPLMIGQGDFQTLTNMRYSEKTIAEILGMTKINSSATSYTGIDNGYHFRKAQPAEDHILVQTTSGSTSRIVKSDTMNNVPAADTFTSFLTLTNNNRVRFSDAPDSAMMIMDGNYNYIYGGTEMRVGAMYASGTDITTTTITDPIDYSQAVNNTLNTTGNIAIIGSDNTSNTKVLLHCDGTDGSTTFTNSASGGSATFTAAGNAQLDTAYQKFGSASAIFDGTGDYIYASDSDDWNFGTGNFTIDFWYRYNGNTSQQDFVAQYQDGSNYWYLAKGNSTNSLSMTFIVSSATRGSYTMTNSWSPTTGQWYHLAFVRSGSSGYIFIDGVSQTLTTGVSFGTNDTGNITGNLQIGASAYPGAECYVNGWMDEIRITKGVALYTANFTPATKPYTNTNYAVVGFTRPVSAVKYYISRGNSTSATLTMKQYTTSGWTALSITDGTTGLSTTGTATFSADTESTAKATIINNQHAYWYYLSLSAGSADIYYITATASVQGVKDIWDGVGRVCTGFFKYTTAYSDYVTNVYEQEYLSTDTTTYAQVGGLTTSQYLYIGFAEPMQGIRLHFPDGAYVSTVTTTMVVSYWDGSSWTACSNVSDGTYSSPSTFKQSGTITWTARAKGEETPRAISNTDSWYYYRLNPLSTTLSADVRIDYVEGIPVQESLLPYRFSTMWQNRLWLFDEQNKNRNLGRCTAYATNCVFNGGDTIAIPFGNSEPVVAANTLFTRFGGTMYDSLIVFKRGAIYLIDGTTPNDFKIYTISDSIGCISPQTLVKCDVSFEVAAGLTRHVLMWLSTRGVEIFDGNTIATVSGDIDTYFTYGNSEFMNTAQINNFAGFYDEVNGEYHLLIATGASTSLDTELVYDIMAKRWYKVDRGTGKALRSGWQVTDQYGYKYTYGGTTDGYVERLEYGTTFDGNGIVGTYQTGDFPLTDSMYLKTELRHLKLTGVAKNTTTNTIGTTIYGDTETSGTALDAKACSSTNRLFRAKWSMSKKATLYSIKQTITTTNETVGFEPLVLSLLYRVTREDSY